MQTLKSMVVGLVMCVLAVAGPAGCNDETERELDEVFEALGRAGSERNAEAFISLVCPDSLTRYTSTARLAWSGKADHIRQLPTGEFVEILWIRHTMYPESIKDATAEDLIRAQVETGYHDFDDSMVNVYLDNARLSGNGKRATADLVIQYKSIAYTDRQKVAFSRGDKGWRIEMDSYADAGGRYIDQMLKRLMNGEDRETAAARMLYNETGARPDRDILRVPPSEM